jgi:hypothetical protein
MRLLPSACLLMSLSMAGLLSAAGAEPGARKPNVLVILADDKYYCEVLHRDHI